MIELLVTLVIVGLATGLTVAAFTEIAGRADTRPAVAPLIQIARTARLAALSEAATVEVRLNTQTNDYLATGYFVDHDSTILSGKIVLPLGASFSAVVPRVKWRFLSDGSAEAEMLTIREASGHPIRILVDPATGEPRVEAP
jgi:hypothetical protein